MTEKKTHTPRRAQHKNHRRLTNAMSDNVADDLNTVERLFERPLTSEERKGVVALATSRDPAERKEWNAIKKFIEPMIQKP